MTTPGQPPSWDERLQRRLARGEETALGELYDQLAPLVHGLAGRILADQAAAEQLTREVFAHLWTHPEAFDPGEGSLRSWLGALTHRRAVDRLRLNRVTALGVSREPRPGAPDGAPDDRSAGTAGPPADVRPPSDASPAPEQPPDGQALPHPPAGSAQTGSPTAGSPLAGALDEEIRAVATAARVQYVVDSLPHPLRETITETYYDGRTYQETAHRLGISEQVAKQRMRLGLQLLATELTEVRDDDGDADATVPPAPGSATAGATAGRLS
ncbi:sigma-70 family RNA polymerase sigma factor [Kitasatospora herbaricolor]|uniref:Sigma-70 family RNA polymerase sigma factor n=1 Tax=Kitasatospora herbaricolor TaxID=68217 RepID=A0ABZ1W998_9ACTN|nr:sigma-70 family RNA polymerase sigma factor [Kitasatospora herbaricolor]